MLSAFIYVFSYTQLQTFWYMYYKNVLAIFLMLFALYFLSEKKNFLLVVPLATAVGFVHRPMFMLLFFVWIAYIITNVRSKRTLKRNFIALVLVGILLLPVYLPRFEEAVLNLTQSTVSSMLEPGAAGPGTFFSSFVYQFVSLSYLPFALLGFVFLVKQKRFSNPLFLWTLVNGLIVVFKLVFFNRFLIPLDVVLIVLSGAGVYYGIVNVRAYAHWLRLGIVGMIFLSAFWTAYGFSSSLKPLLTEAQLDTVKSIANYTEPDSYVMATISYYSPWVLGYSGRKTIAPGLFDYNKWGLNEWAVFWNAENVTDIQELMNLYERPLYVFIETRGGNMQAMNMKKFDDACFEKKFEDVGGTLYKYLC
jgi:hypothetical protein